jgi:DNA polymerase II small subunit
VICVVGVRAKGDLIVAKEILLPDIPDHRPHVAPEEVWAILMSDLHVGSKKFLPDALGRVLDWLNLRIGAPNQRAIAERTKYVVICGDVVDGIGVYPRQEQELAISDLYDQYKEAAKYIGMIPEHIETIVLPGNHDPVRQALPQPAIPKDFGGPIYECRSLISLGNPAEVSLHGVRLLLHHGRSLDDVLSSVPGVDFSQPEKAMKLQLQCRHLASEYGNRTSIAPEKVDHLVIESVPDIFHSGHIHVVKHENYRGTQIINSGAWQAQTDYQKRAGLVPTPGILTAVNLQTLQVRLINFMEA